jgi:uncharacterized protein involved in type VI secretion and phage assembly
MQSRDVDGEGPRYFGIYPAIVTDITKDDRSLGRIEVRFPWLGEAGANVRALATLCSPYADDDQGFEVIPAVDSQVVVAFEAGDLRRPYILGACWNGREKLPSRPERANDKRLIKTRSGSVLEFDDKNGAAKVTLSMKSGHTIELTDSGSSITITHQNGSSIKLESSGSITITANSRFVVNAASVQVNAASSTFSGSVTCASLTTPSVTSASYTPGAGNVW